MRAVHILRWTARSGTLGGVLLAAALLAHVVLLAPNNLLAPGDDFLASVVRVVGVSCAIAWAVAAASSLAVFALSPLSFWRAEWSPRPNPGQAIAQRWGSTSLRNPYS